MRKIPEDRMLRTTAALGACRAMLLVLAVAALVSCTNAAGPDPAEPPATDPEAGVVGDGTAANPYRIRSAADLDAIRGGVSGYEGWDLSDCYKLLADIDLSGYTSWSPMGTFTSDKEHAGLSGTLDGNGHAITNLSIDAVGDFQGLFALVEATGRILDLDLTGVKVSVSGQYVGALAGCNLGSVSGCSSSGSVDGTAVTGALVGENSGSLDGCEATGTVGGGTTVGGLAGRNVGGTISKSSSTASVTATGDYSGGLVGFNYGRIAFGVAKGEVKGVSYVGGLCGYAGGNDSYTCIISASKASGAVTGTGNWIGGFVGYLSYTSSQIASCNSSGAVRGDGQYVGGFCGYCEDASMHECLSSGQVTAGTNYAGGFVGQVSGGTIDYSAAFGPVTGGSLQIGGFAGCSNYSAQIQACYATGAVSAASGSTYIGGFVGWHSSGAIENCFSQGAVSGNDTVGGFAGGLSWDAAAASIANCYSTGPVSGAYPAGGFMGYKGSAPTSCFYDSDSSGRTDTGYGTPRTGAEMRTASTFLGWPTDIWYFPVDGYPTLE